MSRRDMYHDIVKQSLVREGWTITHDPYIFQTDPRLAAGRGDSERFGVWDSGSADSAVDFRFGNRDVRIFEPLIFLIALSFF